MAQTGHPLTRAQSAFLEAAHVLLRSGNTAEALVRARELVRGASMAPDAHQLLGMILAEAGEIAAADEAFRRALALAPGNETIALNFARWLRRSGRPQDALEVMKPLDATVPVSIQRGFAALSMRDLETAQIEFQHALSLQPESSAAWHGLGNALREQGDLVGAETALLRAVELAPADASGWFALGVALRLNGRAEEALTALQRAKALGCDTLQLMNAVNGVLHDAGRVQEALAGARHLITIAPDYPEAHETLANLLWEHGSALSPEEDALAAFAEAAARSPDNLMLQLKLARMMLSAHRAEAALRVIKAADRRRPSDPMLAWYAAEAYDQLGERHMASQCFDAAFNALSNHTDFLNAASRHAFRVGQPEQAARFAAHTVKLDPHNSEAWAHLGTVWRLANDPREFWLFGYENLITQIAVPTPTGFATRDDYAQALTATLESLHSADREPLTQSVRNGSQTAGRLFGRDDPVLRATEMVLRSTVDDWLRTLDRDGRHPFLSRIGRGLRIVGSWSVRLHTLGRHSNHIHNEGWMSSAFHVAVPASIRDEESETHAGWLQFGQPLEDLGLDLAPRRLVHPIPGHVVLFPSYVWHGTIPFEDPEPRLSIAFDMQPMPAKVQ